MAGETRYITYSGGASGDWTVDGTNDQTAINTALAWAAANPGNIIKMRGPHTYSIRGQVKIGSSTTWTAESGVILKIPDGALGSTIANCVFPNGTGVISKLTTIVTGVEIYGFEIDGNCQNQSPNLGADTHGVAGISRGSGVERLIQFQGSDGYESVDINIHHMYIHDAFGEAILAMYCKNIRFHDNICSNHQHEGVYYKAVTGSGNAIYNNKIAGITSGCIRCDSCQNVNIYGNECTSYDGPNKNGAPAFGHSGMQIANNASYSILTNNINVYDNIITGPNLCGIWVNDAKGTAGTKAQTLNIYNNTINGRCGYSRWGWWAAGIAIKWGRGLTIEYNTIDNCYTHGILIAAAIKDSTPTIYIKNNNITNTHTVNDSSTDYTKPDGYAICNTVSTTATASISYCYFSGNSPTPGIVYPTNLAHTNDASVANGIKPGTSTGTDTSGETGGTTGGDVLPEVPVRYIPRSRAVRESLAEFFLEDYTVYDENNEKITSYINKFPIQIVAKNNKTSKKYASNKPSGVDGVNLGVFGWEGVTLTIDCYSPTIDEAWRSVSAWNRRSPAILELGGVFDGWFLSGTPVDISSVQQADEGDFVGEYFYTVMFETDNPWYHSKTERVRSRKVVNSMQWSSDDIYTGTQLLKNPSLESWLEGIEDVAPDRWTFETAGMQMSGDTAHDGANSILITGDGVTEDRGSISQPVACETGFTYILSAYGSASGVTQGKLVVELVSGDTIIKQLVWDDDTEWYQQQILIQYPVALYDAVVRIHVIGTANEGSSFWCDDLYYGPAADLEMAATGSTIQTYGYEDTIPDFEVYAINPNNITSSEEVAGIQATNINNDGNIANSYSTSYTTWNLVLTTTLPQLANGGKYRIDQVSCTLNTYDNATYTAYLEPRIYAASINGGVEQVLASWSTHAVSPPDSFSQNITDKTSANEAVEIRWYAKTDNSSHRAVPKLLTVKYTPLTQSTAYSYVAGTQVVNNYTDLQSTNATDYTLIATTTIAALANSATCRLDGLLAKLAVDNAAATASLLIKAQAPGWQSGVETTIMSWTSTSVDPTFTQKTAVSSQTNFGNGPITVNWYLKTSNASYYAHAKEMTVKYTPMIPQSAPNLDADSTTISIYNTADPTVVLEVCNTLLPKCKFAINADYTGSFEMSDDLSDSLFRSIIVDNGSVTPIYSATERTIELPANSYLTYLIDTKYPVTGIPFIQLFMVSGIAQMFISAYDPVTKAPVYWYGVDSNTGTALENTVIYRELDNSANYSLSGESKYFLCIKPPSGESCKIGSIYHYADLITIDAPRPKVFATEEANTFAAELSGNPVIVTIRLRDAQLVI